MKTKFLGIIAAALVGGLVVGCAKPQKEQISVNFGTQTSFEVIIAQVKGFFDEELAPYNARVEVITFQSGPPQVEALAAKSLDFAILGDQPALQAVASGIPVKIIAGSSDGTETLGLVAREDSGIKTVKDIKGKIIAAPAGTNAYLVLIMYLEKEGLTFDDIEYVNLAIGNITPSLITGDIDGAVAWGTPFTAPPEGERIVKVQSAAGYKRNVGVVIARTEFIGKHPDITVGILRALQKAAKWRVNNYNESLEITANWLGTEKEVLTTSAATIVTLLKLDSTTQDAVLSSADLLYRSDIIAEKLTAEQIFDLKFQEQADLETFPGWGADRANRIVK